MGIGLSRSNQLSQNNSLKVFLLKHQNNSKALKLFSINEEKKKKNRFLPSSLLLSSSALPPSSFLSPYHPQHSSLLCNFVVIAVAPLLLSNPLPHPFPFPTQSPSMSPSSRCHSRRFRSQLQPSLLHPSNLAVIFGKHDLAQSLFFRVNLTGAKQQVVKFHSCFNPSCHT